MPRDSFEYMLFKEHIDKIADLNNKKVLDVGCGEGKLCHFIAQNYDTKEVIGIDPMLWSCYEPDSIVTSTEKLKIIQADCEEIPILDN